MKKIAITFICTGLIILLISFIIKGYTDKQYNELINKFKIMELQKTSKQADSNTSSANNNKNISNDDISNENIIGVIKIPSIALTHPIVDGIDEKVLKVAVGHFTNSKMPWEKGNFALIGHRNYTFSQPFKNLDKVKKGDSIIIETTKGTFKYKVSKSLIVSPDDTYVINDRIGYTITLITCTDHASKRLVVEGDLKEKITK